MSGPRIGIRIKGIPQRGQVLRYHCCHGSWFAKWAKAKDLWLKHTPHVPKG